MVRVGILALQGDYAAHGEAFARAGAEVSWVREAAQFEAVDGLVIPGGESTTMLKLLRYDNMWEPLKVFAAKKPIFGTCAGAILLAREVMNPAQESLGAMDLTVERNAYGRQNESCIASVEPEPDFVDRTGQAKLEAVFIRAPIIRRVGPGVMVLARYKNDPILVEEGLHMVATFHPELTKDVAVQRLFVGKF